MLSLDNAFAEEDVIEFVDRVRRFLRLAAEQLVDIIAEPKIDGLSCSIRYETGASSRPRPAATATRARTSPPTSAWSTEVPQNAAEGRPDIVEVRGEIFMRHADFRALNRRLRRRA